MRSKTWQWSVFVCAILLMGACSADRPVAPDLDGALFSTSVSPSIDAPSNLTSNSASSYVIGLTWQDNSKNETGFEVHRSTAGAAGTFVLVRRTDAGVVTYSDEALSAATQYCYRVRAFRRPGLGNTAYSAFSNTSCSTTPSDAPSAPSNLQAVPENSHLVSITWTDNSATETEFRVEWSTDNGATWTLLAETSPNQTKVYQYNATPDGPPACFRAIAIAGSVASAPSNTDCTTPPAGPTNLTAAAVDQSIVISWTDNSAVEDGYEVRRSATGDFVVTTLPANATSFRDDAVSSDVPYFYVVVAKKDGGYSDQSNYAQAVVASRAPTPPSQVQALPLSSSSASIYWIDNSLNEAGFRIERSTDGGASWTSAGSVGIDGWTFSDIAQPPEQRLCYRVFSFNVKGESLPSNTDCTALPVPPADLAATAVDYQAIDLTWTDRPSSKDGYPVRDGYMVFRLDYVCWDWDNCGWQYENIATLSADATSYRDAGLSSDTWYSYFVATMNDGGLSDPSAEVTATTMSAPAVTATMSRTLVRPSASELRGAAMRATKRVISARMPPRPVVRTPSVRSSFTRSLTKSPRQK